MKKRFPSLPSWVRPAGLAAAAGTLVLLPVLLCLLGRPLWEALLWALALALPLPFRLNLDEPWLTGLSRLFWAAGPVVGYCLVELLNWNHPFLDFTPLQVFLNLCFAYLLAFLVWLLIGRRGLSCTVSTALLYVLGMVNHYVISFRGRTIFPGDLLTLGTAANVAANYDYSFDSLQITATLIFALFLVLKGLLPPQKGRLGPRLRSALPAAVAGGIFLSLFFGTDLVRDAGIEPSLWTTRGNGFLLNFSICLRYSRVDPPDGYSSDAVQALAASTPDASQEGVEPVNVIVVMNESFSDLTATFDLPTNADPMPFLHSLKENAIRGTAYSSVFGGTTANSEYEFLTGNTMAFLPAGAVPYHLYVKDGAVSLAHQLKALDYTCVAMHPYYASGWNRVSVYEDLGFDEQHFLSDFTDTETMRGYVTDLSDYENLVRRYEAKEEGEKLFLFNVTMQSHSGYSVPWTNLPKEVWLTGAWKGRFDTVDQYLNLVRQSDKALEYLIGYFSQVAEPTVLLLFGDHQPQVATNFYTRLLGSDPSPARLQDKQAVPFLLWANYDIPEAEGISTSLNFLSSLLTRTACLPMTGYQSFLWQLGETVSAVNALGYQTPDGSWYAQESDLPPAARQAVEQYKMLQYNSLFEKEEDRLKDFFFLPPRRAKE